MTKLFALTRAVRRGFYYTLTLVTTIMAVALVAKPFLTHPLTLLDFVLLLLFGILIFGVSLSFWSAIIGFLTIVLGGDRCKITRLCAVDQQANEAFPSQQRIALVMPVCNEHPHRVFAGLSATYQSLCETGHGAAFDVFVLSDTSDPELRLAEEQAWYHMRQRFNASDRIFYRNRLKNTGRKSGNIAEFCQRWGGRYEYMIMLDADSIMAGDTLVNLVKIMAKRPQIAILQTAPLAVNQHSLFGRIMQFATSFYGLIYSAGAAFWQLAESNYWGHNAIIRTRAFAAHGSLPNLPGHEPLGGEILSHDFVEAALLREAGWEIWLAYDLSGSYEEIPPNLIDYAKRDRRWCQGNLQHTWFLFAKGFSLISRLHFLMGIMAYLASPFWLLFLMITGFEAYHYGHLLPTYFIGDNPLPVWPISYSLELLALLLVTLGMLFIPKILSLVLLLFQPKKIKQYGGYVPATLSLVLECLFSTLIAPTLMLERTRFVLSILAKRSIGWPTQEREGHRLSVAEASKAHGNQTLIGLGAAWLVYLCLPSFFWWFFPVILGLIVSIPLSIVLSSNYWGALAKKARLFLTPEETQPSRLLTLFRQYHDQE